MESHVAPEEKQDLAAILSERVQAFENAEQVTATARKLSERDRDYRDGKQLSAAEKAAIEARGQPAVVYNRVRRKINAMMGMEKQARKDPKAFPRNPDDEDAARAATDALRYVCDDSRWDDKRSQCAQELATEGTCAVMVGVKQTRAGIDPDIRRIAWDRFYYDPASSEFDFADAKFMGVVIWMDLADAIRKYPDAEEALTATWAQSESTDTYDDKPKHGLWADHKRKRVRLCEEYYDDGGWKFCIYTQAGFVVEPQDSPYMGEDEQPECPIKAVSLYVDRDNNRYGEVRDMIDPQDEINKRRSKALHLISTRQVRVSPNVTQDANKARKELSRADGVFIGEQGDVEILPTNDMAAANLQLLQEAKNEIDLQGANAALAGKNEQSMSGRAIMAQQQGGMVEMATYLDCIRVLSLAVYRSTWCRVRQFWKEERWVRVTDDENNLRFVGMNQPVTALQAMAKQMGVSKEQLPQVMQAAQEGDQQAAQILQQLQAFAQDPRSQQVVAVENNVTELDVDIVVDEGIDTPTVAAEQFDQMLKLAGTGMIPIPGEVLIEASSLRNKGKLLEMMKQQPDPMVEQAKQVQMADAMAKVEKTQSETAENIAQTEKIRTETMTGAFTAGVNSVPQQPGVAA